MMSLAKRLCLLASFLVAPGAWSAAQDPGQPAQRALELLKSGKTEQAITELKKVIAQSPNFFPAYSLLGVSYSQLGKLEEAHGYFKKAVELAPNSTQARNNLGANYLALKKPAEAAAQFEKVVAADPSNLSAWVNLANSQLQLRHFAQALKALEQAQRLAPDDLEVQLALAEARFQAGQAEAATQLVQQLRERSDPRLLVSLGLLLARNGRGPEATDHFRRASKLDPSVIPNLMELSQKSLEQGDYRTALLVLTALEEWHQNSAPWYEMIGHVYSKLEHPEPALKHLQRAIQLDPSNEDYYLELAEFLGNNNAVDTVVTMLETAAKAFPRSVKIQSALGVAYVMIGDVDKAEAVLKGVLEIQPDYEVGYKLLAECYERAQDWNKLEAVALQLRQLNAKNSQGWYYSAMAEYRLFRSQGGESFEKIRRSVQKALQLDPQDWRSHVLLGRLLLEEKRPVEAAAAFQKAIELNNEEPASYYLLATTLRELGKTEESRRALEAFKEVQAKEKARKLRRLLVEVR